MTDKASKKARAARRNAQRAAENLAAAQGLNEAEELETAVAELQRSASEKRRIADDLKTDDDPKSRRQRLSLLREARKLDRIAAEAEARRRALRESQSRLTFAAAAEQRRARHLLAPIRDPDPDENIVVLLAKAEAQRARASSLDEKARAAGRAGRDARSQRKRHLTAARLLDLEAAEARERQIESHRQSLDAAEITAVATARGELVTSEIARIATPVVDEDGVRVIRDGMTVYRQENVTRVRVLSRGGLQLAFERGDLDGAGVKAERLLDTGNAYRWAFETCSAITTPARDPGGGSRSPLKASAGPQDAVFAAGEMLRDFRQGLDDRQRVVLDGVCGQDMTVNAMAIQLGSDSRTVRKLLAEGLIRAMESRKAAGRKDGVDREYKNGACIAA